MNQPCYYIYDSNPITVSVLTATLEIIGKCTYKVFETYSQLIKALDNSVRPDKIFCNVTARGCDARELCHHYDRSIPMIFISELFKHEERMQCYLKTGFPYVSGPLTIDSIQKYL